MKFFEVAIGGFSSAMKGIFERDSVVLSSMLFKKTMLAIALATMALGAVPVCAASDLETGIQELAAQIAEGMAKRGNTRIAVIEFSELDGRISAFGQYLAEDLITQIVKTSPEKFEVVERMQLQRVLQEQRLSVTGLVDRETIASVGKILGIEALVTGSIVDLGNEVKINARLLSVDSAKVFAVASVKVPKVDTVVNLMNQEVARVDLLGPADEGLRGNRKLRSSERDLSEFKTSFLKIRVTAARRSAESNRIHMALEVVNLTEGEIFIAFESGTAMLVDEMGAYYRVKAINGLEYSNAHGLKSRRNYSILAPHVRYPVALSFSATNWFNSENFSFSASCFRFDRGGGKGFTVGISGIHLSPADS